MLSPEKQYAVIQQGLLGRLFGDFPFAALVCNADLRLVWVNAAFSRLYGYEPESIIGLPSMVLRAPEFADEKVNAIRSRLMNKRDTWSGAFRCRRKDGTVFDANAIVMPIDHFPDVPVSGIFSVSWDPTDQNLTADKVVSHMVSGCLRLDSLGGLAAATEKKEGVSSRGARQREVQRLVSLGYSSKDIGSIMNISPSTVNVVRWKLGLAEPVRTRRRTRSVGRKKTAASP